MHGCEAGVEFEDCDGSFEGVSFDEWKSPTAGLGGGHTSVVTAGVF